MITLSNYNEKKSSINWNDLPAAVRDNREDVEDMLDLHGEDKAIDKMIDTFIAKINKGAIKKDPEPIKKEPMAKKQKAKGQAGKSIHLMDTSKPLVPKHKVWRKDGDLFVSRGFIDASKGQLPNSVFDDEHDVVYIRLLRLPNKGQINFVLWDVKIPFINGQVFQMRDNDQGELLSELIRKMGAQILDITEDEKPTAKNKPTKKQPAKKIKKAVVDVKLVNNFSEEFKLLRRFLNATKKETLTYRQVRLLYMAFNKAAVSRNVRKSSDKGDEFEKANEGITKIFEQSQNSDQAKERGIKLEIENTKLIKELTAYVAGTKINYAVTLLRSFISMQGTIPGKEKAERLLKRFTNAFKTDRVNDKNRLYDQVMDAISELKEYLKSPKEKVDVEMYGLSVPGKKVCENRIKCAGLTPNGQLKPGYKFSNGGKVIKSKKKAKAIKSKPSKKKSKPEGLNQPAQIYHQEEQAEQPVPFNILDYIVEPIEKEITKSMKEALVMPSKKSYRGQNLQDSMNTVSNNEIFPLNGEIGKFLGQVEKKPIHSVVTTLDAEQGAGKTRFLFQVINALAAAGVKCLFYSLEEHPQSSLFKNKVDQYIDPANFQNITIVDEVENWKDEKVAINAHEAIFFDSFQKLPVIDLDKDMRKAFNSKWFFVIYQQTGTKGMRGGSRAAFDGDIILKVKKADDYRDNYVYANKNRYNDMPEFHYNIFSKQLSGDNGHSQSKASTGSANEPLGRLIAIAIQ